MNSGELNLKKVYDVENRITENGLKNSNTKIIPKNSILIGLAGQGKTRGTVAMNLVELCINQSIASIYPNPFIFYEYFLYHNLDNRYFELRNLSKGDGGRGGLNLQIIKSISVNLPSINEQIKISDFLNSVDNRIEKLTKKKKLLEKYKKGIMQKIFNQEIRFKDENGNDFSDWEEKTLGDLLSNPIKIKPSQIDKNNILTVKLHLQGVQKNTNTENLLLGSTNYYVRKKGQFIYGKQNLFNGAFGIIPPELDGFFSSGDVPALDININIVISEFLLFYLSRKSFYSKLEVFASGTGSKRIHEETLFKITINIPCFKEQKKIVIFLSSIDKKINLLKSELDKLQKWKKGLLQQMFI